MHGHADHRVGEVDLLQDDRRRRVAERVAGNRVSQAHQGSDLAAFQALDHLLVVGVHTKDAPYALLFVFVGVEHVAARDYGPGVDPHIDQLAHVFVTDQLKGECGQGLLVAGFAFQRLALRVFAFDATGFRRRGQIVDDRVQQPAHTFIAEGTAAKHRADMLAHGGSTQRCNYLFLAELLSGAVFVEKRLVQLGHVFKHIVAPFLGILQVFRADVLLHRVGPLGVLDIAHLAELDQVYDALEVRPLFDGNGDGHGIGAQNRAYLAEHAEKIRPGAVHLVDKADARHLVFAGLAPDRLGLRLDSAHRAEQADGAVQDAQAAFHLDGEIDVSGGVDDVDLVLAPDTGGGRAANGDAAFLFLHHKVHSGLPVMGLAEFMRAPGIVQYALGAGSLAGVNMRHNTYVSNFV